MRTNHRYVVPVLFLMVSFGLISRGETSRDISVDAKYSATTTQPIGAAGNTIINFPTFIFDSANAALSGAGSNWKFIAPVVGKYLVTAQVSLTGTWAAGDTVALQVYGPTTTQTDYRRVNAAFSGLLTVTGSTVFHLNETDSIQINIMNSSSAKTLTNDGTDNVVTVSRVGD